ncbi:MAG: hypothetical protein ABEI52_09630 [Halobacteriaceae archaeon]
MSGPTLTAEVTDDDNPRLEIEVTNSDGTVVDSRTADVAALLQMNQFVSTFEQPALMLLAAQNNNETNAQENGREEIANAELEDTPTQ